MSVSAGFHLRQNRLSILLCLYLHRYSQCSLPDFPCSASGFSISFGRIRNGFPLWKEPVRILRIIPAIWNVSENLSQIYSAQAAIPPRQKLWSTFPRKSFLKHTRSENAFYDTLCLENALYDTLCLENAFYDTLCLENAFYDTFCSENAFLRLTLPEKKFLKHALVWCSRCNPCAYSFKNINLRSAVISCSNPASVLYLSLLNC